MRNKFIIIFLMICITILCSCQKDTSIEQENTDDFLTIYKLETISQEDVNQEWNKEIEKQLINQFGLNELQINKQINNSIFEICKVEYGTDQEYEKSSYPYSIISDMTIWKSDDFYSICEIRNKEIKSLDENIVLVKEKPDELWNEGEFLLKVLPINQATLYTIGGRASFMKDKQEKVGPFTMVQSFYIACP